MNNTETGKYGEKIAAQYLKKNGYRIIGVNVHVGNSEIDIISVYGNTLVFVEVKTRTVSDVKQALARPADAVNKEKITYLVRGANGFCRENSEKYGNYFKRFDILEVYLEKNGKKIICKEIKHFENAI